MKCFFTYVVIALLGLAMSCANKATIPEDRILFGAHVSSIFGGGLFPIRTEMRITPTGEVTVQNIDGRDGSVVREGQRLLSNSETTRLQTLFEPFAGFDSYYSPENPPTDLGSVRIGLKRDDVDHEVVVYPAGYSEIPEGLRELVDELLALSSEVLEE